MNAVLLLLLAAPLPFARPAKPAPEPAVYYCQWGGPSGCLFDIRFYPGGKYECRRLEKGPIGPVCYAGEWEQDGPTLVVRERSAGSTSDAYTCRWSVGPAGATIDDKPADICLERVK